MRSIQSKGPIDLSSLFGLIDVVDRPDLLAPALQPRTSPELTEGCDLFDQIAKNDVMLHHPFDSFRPVVNFIRQAARDPDVLAIKQTFYRTSGDSPIVDALIEAAAVGQACHRTGRAQGTVRRGEQHLLGKANGTLGRACCVRLHGPQDSQQVSPCREARGKEDSRATPTSAPATTTRPPPDSTPTSACSRPIDG